MKVLLLSPPYLPYYMRNARCDFVSLSGTQWYPILLGYCGAWLEKCGHEVRFIDAPTYHLDRSETMRLAEEFRPDWLVVYTGRLSEDTDIEISEALTRALRCRTGCGAVKEILYFTPYGDVLACPFLHFSLGNVFEEDLDTIQRRALRNPYFALYYPVCLAAEHRDFIERYLGSFYDSAGGVRRISPEGILPWAG